MSRRSVTASVAGTARPDGEIEFQRPVRWARRRLRETIQDNGWIAPAVGAATGTILGIAVGTLAADTEPWTLSVDRSRDVMGNALALVFTAMSIVLALASVAAQGVANRFGSRALRIYARRSADRWVIATFAMAAMFILAVQYDMRRLDADAPAPSVALSVGIVLLVVTAWTVIWYVASIVRWFRVDRVAHDIATVVRRAAADRVRERGGGVIVDRLPDRPASAVDLVAPATGHIAEVDADVLIEHCRRHDVSIVVSRPIGYPVVAGQSIGWVELTSEADEGLGRAISAQSIDVADSREVAHTVEYGLTALVDIAVIALSPAVNDPNSAGEVVEELMFLFHDLAGMRLGPYEVTSPDGQRVVVWSRGFGDLLDFATVQLVRYGLDDPLAHEALRRFASSLQLLELAPDDRARVDAFAARVEARPNTDGERGEALRPGRR